MARLRLVNLLLAVMLILAGCGDKKDPVKGMDDLKVEANSGSGEESSAGNTEDDETDNSGEGNDASGDTSTKESAKEDAKENEKENAGGNADINAGEIVTAPTFTRTVWIDNRYTDDGTLLVEGKFTGIEVSGEGYEAAAKAVQDYFAEKEKAFTDSMDLYEEAALEDMQYAVDFLGYSASAEYSVERIDSSVTSVKGFHYAYTGGVHGNYGSVGATFDAKTGAELSFWDLAKDKKAFAEATLDSCLTQVSAEYEEGLYEDYEEIIRSIWAEEPNWYLDAAGITVIFTPYEIGPYAMGEVYVTLPYQELADLMKSEYQMESVPGVALLKEGAAAAVCLEKAISGETNSEKQNSKKQTVKLHAEDSGTGGIVSGFRKIMLEVGDKAECVAELDRLSSIYLLRREDGRSFLLFDGDMASDDYVTFVYEITDGDIQKVQETTVGTSIREAGVTLQGVELGIRVDAMGTYTAYGDYKMTENGTLEIAGEWMTIEPMYEGQILTVTRDLPVVVEGKKTVLSAGSRIQIVGTNGKDILRCCTVGDDTAADVLEGEIHYTRGENGWPVYIDGVNETEYFEDLPYAG